MAVSTVQELRTRNRKRTATVNYRTETRELWNRDLALAIEIRNLKLDDSNSSLS